MFTTDLGSSDSWDLVLACEARNRGANDMSEFRTAERPWETVGWNFPRSKTT